MHSAAAAATDLGSFGESRNTAAMLQSTPLQQDRNVQDMSSQQQQQQQIRCGNMQGQYTNECNEINAAQEQLPKQLQKQQDTNMQQTDWEDIAAAAAAQQQQGGAGQQQQSAQEQLKPHKPRPTHFVALRVSHSQQVTNAISRYGHTFLKLFHASDVLSGFVVRFRSQSARCWHPGDARSRLHGACLQHKV